jgi:hypothetical protein
MLLKAKYRNIFVKKFGEKSKKNTLILLIIVFSGKKLFHARNGPNYQELQVEGKKHHNHFKDFQLSCSAKLVNNLLKYLFLHFSL